MNLDQHIQMLGHKDPAQRRKAIIALGKSGDKRALQPLAKVYKTDPEPELRDLALKAGRNIQKTATSSLPEPPPPDYSQFSFNEPSTSYSRQEELPDWMSMAAPASSTLVTPAKKISTADKQKAKSSLDRAIDASMKTDWNAVAHHLKEALERDPDIEKNTTFMGLAAQVTHADPSRAANALRQMEIPKKTSKPPKSRRSTYGDEPGGPEFLVEWPIWLILLGLIFSGSAFFVLRSATDLFDEDFQATSDQGETIYVDENGNLVSVTETGEVVESEISVEDIEEFVSDYGPITSLAFGFAFSLVAMIFSTFSNYITWFTGNFMGGSGALFNFLVATMRVDVVGNLLTGVMYAVIIALAASSADDPTADPTQISSLQCVFGLIGLGLFGVKSWIVGVKHEFGFGMGIANVIVGGIATAILGACCYCGLLSALVGSVPSAQ